MCGIIAVVRRRTDRAPATAAEILGPLRDAVATLDGEALAADPGIALDDAAGAVEVSDGLLRGTPGVHSLMADPALATSAEALLDQLDEHADRIEASMDSTRVDLPLEGVERVNAGLVRLRDAVWAVRRDRIPTATHVRALAGADAGPAAVAAYLSIQQALSAIDRLEVRGRDSAGLHIQVTGHGLDLSEPGVAAQLGARRGGGRFGSGSVQTDGESLAFVYKAAAEIGELGDNTAALRAEITEDALLAQSLAHPEAEAVVLGHTRWASVGIISEANAHPLCSEETDGVARPYVAAALNGDVDNHADLKADQGLAIAAEITTDAKVIPTSVARRLDEGQGLDESFRLTACSLDGSVAVAAGNGVEPGRLHLALRGSGQALYVGLAEDVFIAASEPYGVVEETDTYLRLDGEQPSDPDNPTASRGQIVVLDRAGAGTVEGLRRISYDGTELPIAAADLTRAEITTRDIDRGDYPHFLLKEISEAPASFRKTLRQKLTEVDGELTVTLGPETLSDDLRARLADGRIRRVVVVGQGTAAIAGRSLAAALERYTAGIDLRVDVTPATELSGFGLVADMSDTLVVAISQSGTTTDTNRTVDLVRSRGAAVLAIVNRRNSDLTDKADGVLYTSDGRDVEMSVASTKAFYAQVAAGVLLANALADVLDAPDEQARHAELVALRALPDAMAATLERRAEIGEAARSVAPSRRYWAVVGNGTNFIAANEVRIKLSELCYKSIACDTTEDKKHIDLSAEPMILICAAGLSGSTADDVAKEVAIYRAHKAAPVVVATEGEGRFAAALHVLSVPETHPDLAFVLSAMVGHLFGYEAALAIDDQARPLREARAAIEEAVAAVPQDGGDGDRLLRKLRPAFEPLAARFFDGLRSGAHDGQLEASTAARLASMFRYALAITPLDSYQAENGKVGTPSVVVEDLTASLTRAIDELTRPIDAIKHQAKTVTVGISRSDESLLQIPLVAEVTGFTRYRIEGDIDSAEATAVVVDRGGVAAGLVSRTDSEPRLRGTKNRVATERLVLVAAGRSDGRTIVLVPEVKDGTADGLTLLHVRFVDGLGVAAARGVLSGYRNRYAALRDAVTETEPTFREDLLAEMPVAELLTEPISDLADRWRTDG